MGSQFYDFLHPDQVSDSTATTFNNFSLYPQRTDPFTLDLDGDGIETVGVNQSTPLLFDIDADGIKKSVGWVKADDGLLALDRDGNGTIDSGAELFGDATPVFDTQGNLIRQAADGFDALAQQDSNLDGVIDHLDTNWSNLRVWQDANQDGISQAAELKTLAQLNITAIHLAKVENSLPLSNGNVLADLGSYTRADGTQGGAGTAAQLADIDLATDSFHSQFADHIPLTTEASLLPDIQGSGQVRSLREAASLDTPAGVALAALLTQYSQATTKAAQLALLDGLIRAWSDTSPMAATFTGAYAGHALTVDMQAGYTGLSAGSPAYQAMADKLTIMEHFNGRTYQPVPEGSDPVTITLWHAPQEMLNLSYEALRTSVYDSLALQTRLKPYLDAIDLSITDTGPSTGSGQAIHLDFTQVKADFIAKIDLDPANGLADVMDFNASTREMLAASEWNGVELIVQYLADHSMTAQLQAAMASNGIFVKGMAGWSDSGSAGDDLMIGDGADDMLSGFGGSDTLLGGAGNDVLSGGTGNDTLDGGAGNDTLYGGYSGYAGGNGNDTYRFGKGDGTDTIWDYDPTPGNTDVLRFKAGVTPGEVALSRPLVDGANADLLLTITTTGDSIRIRDWFHFDGSGDYRVEQVLFDDGTVWGTAQLQMAPIMGTAGGETLTGLDNLGETIDALAGDDTLDGKGGDDLLLGGAGNDVLSGGTGNDTLDGGAGNDTLYGGYSGYAGGNGNDTYRFGKGDGTDTIWDYDPTPGNTDVLRFKAGVTPGEVALSRPLVDGANADLLLTITTTGDSIRIREWFHFDGSGDYRVEQVVFDDGTVWGTAQLQMATIVGSAGNDTFTGGSGNDYYDGADGNDNIVGNAGNDVLFGGAGNDLLNGGSGNDTLDGGVGTDTLIGGAGNDTYMVDDVGDTVTENAGEGTDTVLSSIGYTLGANVENLTLVGGGAINGTGNSLANTLTGNWNSNVLDGDGGADTLIGGAGDDTYKFSVGGGADIIVDSSGTDQLVFGEGIVESGVTASRMGSQVKLAISATDSVTFDETAPGQYSVETVSFASGTVWQAADIRQRVNLTPTGGVAVSGIATQNQILTASNTLADLDGLGSIGYQWQCSADAGVSWAAIGGATASTFTLTEAQVGKLVRVNASYTDGHGTVESVSSTATTAIANVNDAPTGTVTVTVSGTATQNQILTASNTLADLDGLGTIGYQWQSSADAGVTWAAIGGATASTFTLTEAQVGQLVRVIAGYTDGHGTEESVASAATTAVANVNDAPTGAVIVTGTATQNQMLTVANTLSDLDGLSAIGYQWQSSADAGVTWNAIGGATAETLTLREAQVGKLVRVAASYIDGHGTSESVFSAATATVGPAQTGNNPPLIGSPIPNQTAIEDFAFGFAVPPSTFSDPDAGDSLSFTSSLLDGPLPAWLVFDAGSRTFSGTPSPTASGQLNVRVTATDSGGLTVSNSFTLNVLNHVLGTGQGETMSGTEGDDYLEGLGGNDTIDGGAGNDIIVGGTGSDNLIGGAGDDTFLISGTDGGYDRFEGDAGYDVVRGGAGDDTIRLYQYTGVAMVEKIDGGGGYDVIAGTAAYDTLDFSATELVGIALIDGGAGNDTIIGSAGNDIIIGGTGADNLIGGGGDDTFLISGTDGGYDRFEGDAGYDVVRGSAGDDTIRLYQYTGVATVEKIDGGGGYDVIAGTGAYDTLDFSATELVGIALIDGGAGNDTIIGSAGNDIIIGGTGSDNLIGGAGDDTFLISGTDGGYDRFEGDAGYDVVRGSAGDDTIRLYQYTGVATVEKIDGGGGYDIIAGTGGYDTLDFSGTELVGIALIDGGDGNDTIIGTAGADLIIGGTGSDNLIGGAGDDTFLISGTDGGYDRFEGDAGYDVVRGSAGDDTIRLYQYTGVATVEKIDGGGGYDIIAGTGGYDTLDFSATELVGIALIDGGAGNDTIIGSAGNDIIIGGTGSDNLIGGGGDDTFLISGTDGGYDRFEGDAGYDVVRGSAGDDTIRLYQYTGVATVEKIDGGGGYDIIAGTGGYDTLDFSATELVGIALIDGGAGNDTITGSAGADIIAGGGGNDTLKGGTGNDTYRMARGDGADTIVENDATPGNADVAEFLAGITADQIWLRHIGNSLEASIIGTADKLTIENWYLGSPYHIEQFHTADNRVLLDSRVELLVQAMAAFAPPAAGQTTLPPSYQDSLAPVIAANWQ